MSQRSILLMEKNLKIVRTIEVAAQRRGFICHSVPWGEDIIKTLQSNPVDIVLMNTRQISGSIQSICGTIRDHPQFARLPLIILYGKPAKETRKDYLKFGADDYIPMPFAPMDLMDLLEIRLRPLESLLETGTPLSGLTPYKQESQAENLPEPLSGRGELEFVPMTSLLARLFLNRQSGILTLIIKKETRSIYFDKGNIVFAESLSKKDDLGDFMARNGAGAGTGKDIIAARNQAGGPGCDPREFRSILREVNLMDYDTFRWWVKAYILEFVANLFSKKLGSFNWQNLPLPSRATSLNVTPLHTPSVIFEGIRRLTKWWALRELLPLETMIPILVPEFPEKAMQHGMTLQEILMMDVADGQRSLKEIREICHRTAQGIDNYIFACRELMLLSFAEPGEGMEKRMDVYSDMITGDEAEPDQEGEAENRMPEQPVPVRASEEPHVPLTPPPVKVPDTIALEPPISTSPSTPASSPEPAAETPHGASGGSTPTQAEPPRSAGSTSAQAIPSSKPPKKVEEPLNTSGSLAELPIPEIFRTCLERSFSGCVTFENLGIFKEAFWKKGRIITVSSTDIDERLDNFLYRKHIITSEQRDDIRKLHEDLIRTPNEYLKRGLLSIEQLFIIVKEQFEMMIVDLFNWVDGKYEFMEGKNPPRDAVPMDIFPIPVILKGFHEMYSWKHLEDFLPKNGDRITINTENTSHQSALNLSALELKILNVITEPLPVGEIIRRTESKPDLARQALYALEIAQLLNRRGSRRGRTTSP